MKKRDSQSARYERCVRHVRGRSVPRRNPTNRQLLRVWSDHHGRELELYSGDRPTEVASLYVSRSLGSGSRAVTFFVYAKPSNAIAIGKLTAAGDAVWRTQYGQTSQTIEEHGALFDQMLQLYYDLLDAPDGEYVVDMG